MQRFAADGVRTSLLDVPGMASVTGVGLPPVGEVMGCIVEHIGWQGFGGCGWVGFGSLGGVPATVPIGIPGTFGGGIAGGRRATTVTSGQRGAYVGYQPYVDGFSWWNNRDLPFTSDLSGQDFWTLLQAGYAPLGRVMGSCVYHIAHQRFWQAIGNTGQNVEIPQFTEALYDARELAMSRMQVEAEQLAAEGIVGVQLLSLPHRWGGHTTEFFAIGTAVRPLREDHRIATPSLVLPLTDR